MTNCYHCGMEVMGEGFRCKECGQIYCHFHKEPIDHDCNIVQEALNLQQYRSQNLNRAQISPTSPFLEDRVYSAQAQKPDISSLNGSTIRGTTNGSFTWYRQERAIPPNAFDPDSGIEFKGILFPYKSEVLHFLIGSAFIFLIGIVSFYNPQLINLNLGWAIYLLAGFYATAFLFHELGHRQTAIHFGLQTKFRLLTFGMILTAIGLVSGLSALILNSPAIPTLALPGAVVVLGLDKIDRKTGLCKAAGPIINLTYGSILLVTSFIIPRAYYPLNMFVGLAAALNFTLGLFNMIPIGILDGQNILKWNKPLYVILVGSLFLLLLITYANVYAPIETSWYVPEAWQAMR